MSKPPYAVLVSRRSRLGSSILGRLESDHRGRAAFVLPVQTEGQMKAGIEWARQEGVESVWVAGGDGTIRRAAGLLAGGPMTLAVLPIGTGNALARDLNLPLNPFAAAEFHLRNRHREQIDLGFCNGMPFVNSVTAGLTTSIVRHLDREEKKAFGPLAYLPAVLRGLSGAEAVALTIRTEREEHRGRFLQLVAASGRGHAGPFPVTEAASLIDGRLSVYAVGETAESSLTDYVAGLVTRTHWLLPHVWTAEAARVEIIAEKPMSWVVDGDRITAERLDLEIRAGALRVSSPPLCK